jgi:hypothetical protein
LQDLDLFFSEGRPHPFGLLLGMRFSLAIFWLEKKKKENCFKEKKIEQKKKKTIL